MWHGQCSKTVFKFLNMTWYFNYFIILDTLKCSGKVIPQSFWPQKWSMGISNSSPKLVQVSLATRKLGWVIWQTPATLRKCSGKVIPQGFLTPKVIHGHFKFIPQTSPGVISNPQIRVCHLTKPSHSQEMLWKSHSAGVFDPKSDLWALQIHPPDKSRCHYQPAN